MSPTTKSAGTPSEAGSQDSDGAVGPRYTHRHTQTYTDIHTYTLHSKSGSNKIFSLLIVQYITSVETMPTSLFRKN